MPLNFFQTCMHMHMCVCVCVYMCCLGEDRGSLVSQKKEGVFSVVAKDVDDFACNGMGARVCRGNGAGTENNGV